MALLASTTLLIRSARPGDGTSGDRRWALVMGAIVYDTGALIAAERQDPGLLALHSLVTSQGDQPLVPVVVLAQAWRGGSQPRLSLLLKGCLVLPDHEVIGKAAGALCAAARTTDVVDAVVVVTAVARTASVVTSDPGDLRHLADVMGVKLRLHVI